MSGTPEDKMHCPSPFPATIRRVGIFCPAGSPPSDKLEKGCHQLRAWGLGVYRAGIPSPPDRYLAATDTQRVRAFHELLSRDDLDAILAARGGYGCARLLDLIDWDLWQKSSKPVIGYSDLTALHLGAVAHGITTGIYGPMVASEMARDGDDQSSAEFATSMSWFSQTWSPAGPAAPAAFASASVLQHGTADGPIVPATLAVLVSLLGTPHMPDLQNAILVLEDINEPAYRIDRYMTQLRQAGILESLAGLVLGEFGACDHPEWLPPTFAEFAACIPGPVIAGLPFGHRFPSLSFPVGRNGMLQTMNEGSRLSWT